MNGQSIGARGGAFVLPGELRAAMSEREREATQREVLWRHVLERVESLEDGVLLADVLCALKPLQEREEEEESAPTS